MKKVEYFQIVRKYFAHLGIRSNQLRSNERSAIVLSSSSLATVFDTVFFFFKAKNFQEYTLNIYSTSVTFACWITFITILTEKNKLFELIENIETFADKSK